MILAGIDEAGLGPTLGPLATASAALETPDGWEPSSPWEKLDAVFCREWKKGDMRLPVADSKVLYRTGGLAAFEQTVGAFSLLASDTMTPRVVVSDTVPNIPPGAERIPAHPCYGEDEDAIPVFPAYCGAGAIQDAAERARRIFAVCGVGAVHLETALLYESRLNARFDAGLNKNEALLMETGRRVAALADRFAGRRGGLLIVVDKQGGRNAYLPFLTEIFPGAWVEELEEGREVSRYRVRLPQARGGVAIEFRAKGDRVSFATALASLAAKYARECAMAKLNSWFCKRFPGLKPTAGYPEDAKRWIRDVRDSGGDEHIAQAIRRR